MRQYLAAKAAHPDALLFFRMGDFYELFFDDAVVAARALDLTLTAATRARTTRSRWPACRITRRAAYIQRLLEQGYKVAICEQMADPSKVKGIVPREVVRVVTPGIVYDDAGLDARQNHYLVGRRARRRAGPFGIAALDLSTGELVGVRGGRRGERARRARAPRPARGARRARGARASRRRSPPRAAAAPSCASDRRRRSTDADGRRACSTTLLGAGRGASVVRVARSRGAPRRAASRSRARASRAGRCRSRGSSSTRSATRSCSTRRRRRTSSSCASVDGDDARLAPRADRRDEDGPGRAPAAPPAARAADATSPRSAAGSTRSSSSSRSPGCARELRDALADVGDLERLAVKLALDRAAPRDLVALRALARARSRRSPPRSTRCPDPTRARGARRRRRRAVDRRVRRPHALLAARRRRRAAAARARRRRHPRRLRRRARRGARADARRAAAHRRARGALARDVAASPSLKLRYTRVFGWYIEVTRAHVAKAPAAWRRKQTVASGERFTCDELDDARRQARARRGARARARGGALRARSCASSPPRASALRARRGAPRRVGRRAPRSPRSRTATTTRGPRSTTRSSSCSRTARHPVVEQLAAAGRFVPNDVSLGAGRRGRPRLWLVTGPNMAGKSTLMRQVALARDPRADGVLRAGAARAHRRRRSRAHARRRERQPRRAARARSWSR